MPDGGADERAQDPARRRVVLLVVLLGAGALSLVVGVLPQLPPAGQTLWPWWLLVPAFAAAEVVVVHVAYGRDDVRTISFGEVPIVLGLAFAEPMGFIAASAVGSGVGLLVHRGQRGVKLAFNIALFTLEASLALATYHLLLGDAAPHEPRGLLAAVLTIVVTDLVSATAITAVIALDTGHVDGEVLVESVTTGLTAAVTNTSVALLVVVALEHEPGALLLLVPVLVALFLSYRGYTSLSSGHYRLERLYRFTQGVGRALPVDEVLVDLLTRTREVLGAQVSGLVLPAADGGPARLLRLGDDDAVTERAVRVDALAGGPDGWWAPALAGEPVLCAREQDPALPVEQGLAAPLPLDDGLTGVLLVADRPAHADPFRAAELPLVASLANHAAVALRNAHLIDRLRQEAAERRHEATHDALTGLPNRRAFLAALGEQLTCGRPGVVVLLGLDGFQDINDALGPDTGDLLLVAAGQRLQERLPEALCTARLGGDEFAVLLPVAGDDAADAARRAVEALDAAFSVRGLRIELRGSAGAARWPEHGDAAGLLLQRAELAMYTAKRERTGAEVYDPLSDHGAARRLQLTAALRTAVAEGQVEVHYQPKVQPRTGAVLGAEALARWRHPELGPVSPEEFVPLAEHTGLIGPLTSLVLQRALEQCRRWRAAGRPLSVAVNLSARSLGDDGLPDQVARLLADSGVPAAALTLEITESVVMADPERSLRVLHELRALGLRLSVDDFGTGMSSLAYLTRLPVHEVKVDRSFVSGLLTDVGARAIVHAAVRLVHDLGMSVVAEGVEDEATQARLAAWGCDSVQGYLHSRPLGAAAFEQWLVRRDAAALLPRTAAV